MDGLIRLFFACSFTSIILITFSIFGGTFGGAFLEVLYGGRFWRYFWRYFLEVLFAYKTEVHYR